MKAKQMSIFDVLSVGEPILGTWFEEYPGDPVPWDEVFSQGVGKVFLVDVSTESHIWLKAVRIIRAFWYDGNCFYAGLAPHMVRRVVWDDGGRQHGMYTGDYWPDEANRRFYRWENLKPCP